MLLLWLKVSVLVEVQPFLAKLNYIVSNIEV
jgi:hypothetical protein